MRIYQWIPANRNPGISIGPGSSSRSSNKRDPKQAERRPANLTTESHVGRQKPPSITSRTKIGAGTPSHRPPSPRGPRSKNGTSARRASGQSASSRLRARRARKRCEGSRDQAAAAAAGRASLQRSEICVRPSRLLELEEPAQLLGVQAILRPHRVLLHAVEHRGRSDTNPDSVKNELLALDGLVAKGLA